MPQAPFQSREDALAASTGCASEALGLATATYATPEDREVAQVLATLAQTYATHALALPPESAIRMVPIGPEFFDRDRVRYAPGGEQDQPDVAGDREVHVPEPVVDPITGITVTPAND